MEHGLTHRLREIVQAETTSHRRFKELEEQTGIAANTWKSWWHGRQRPTTDMIERIARTWPQYAFWLATGIDDWEHGHVDAYQPATQTFQLPLERRHAARLFKLKIERDEYVQEQYRLNPHFDSDERLEATDSAIQKVAHLRDEEEKTLGRLENDDKKD